jgi:hypothetical protein
MTRMAIIALIGGAMLAGTFLYIRSAERAKLENANTKATIEGIRDAREIENETRDAGDDDLRRILIDGL